MCRAKYIKEGKYYQQYFPSFRFVLTNLYFGHVLTVNSRCYGCCYVNNLYHCVHSPEINSATLFQNDFQFLVFQGSQILYFQKLEVFHEHRHIFWKVAPQILIMLRRSERSERAAANMPGLHCLQKNQNALRYECDDNSLSLFLSKQAISELPFTSFSK